MAYDNRNHRKYDRKRQQLCSQVGKAVDLALGASSDPLLQGCFVVNVSPAPDAARLRIRVQTWDPITPELTAHLRNAVPWLRSEVAHSIHRKKVPQLTLEAVGPGSHTL